MRQRIGTCSLCGGDVMGYRGAWYSVLPPPPDECTSCGAVVASDVIEMALAPRRRHYFQTTATTRVVPAP